MAPAAYQTIDDLRAIVTDDISESVVLEYKRSAALTDRDVICKAVTAFANSVGGHLLIGIEAKDGRPIRLDGGFVGASKLDWVYKIINANTFPPVETVNVFGFSDGRGSYYVIEVRQSARAPHQSADYRYYKRRGSHSEPMEHYEVEDVRNRPKQPISPLQIGLHVDEFMAVLVVENTHRTDAIRNICCEVRENFGLADGRLSSLKTRGIRELHPRSDRRFVLNTVPAILNKHKEAEIEFKMCYDFRDARLTASETFYFADLNNTMVVRSPVEKAIAKLGEKADRLAGELEKLRREVEKIAGIADGTGLRLSQRTIRALQKKEQLFEPREFDWQGYKIVLGISDDDALALHHIFGYLGGTDQLAQQYENLPAELREKFEAYFKVDFT